MTVNGVQNIILQLLSKQDIISLSEIKLVSREGLKDEKLLEKLIHLSINKLLATGLIETLDDGFWVLVKPLNSFRQTIEIDGILAAGIANVLNAAASILAEEKVELCNSLSISSEDIETLVLIADNINKRDNGSFDQEGNGDDEFKLPQ